MSASHIVVGEGRTNCSRLANSFARIGIPSIGFRADKLSVHVFRNREEMGRAAAFAFEQQVQRVVDRHGAFRGIFAAAPSQNDVYASLIQSGTFPWQAAEGLFMMDEYTKLSPTDPRSFRYYHNTKLWGPLLSLGRALDPQKIFQLYGEAQPEAECLRYAGLLAAGKAPVVVEGGFGEINAHIAFNDPPEADFGDPFLVKLIELAIEAKQQQVNEGHYASVEELPDALTLTVPALTRNPFYTVNYWSSVVPTENKASGVFAALFSPVSAAIPGTALRSSMVGSASLFLDLASSYLVREELSRLDFLDFSSLERTPSPARQEPAPHDPIEGLGGSEDGMEPLSERKGGTGEQLRGRDMG
ncbi:MAG: hypothetical protein WC490_06250 [Candidatus Margulisiibacteriota bacterium]